MNNTAAETLIPNLQQSLDRTFQPVNDYAARQTAMALSDRNRALDETAAERASKRRMKEFAESERQRLIQKYAEQGVNVKSGDSIEEANAKFRQFSEQRASNLLQHYTSQLSDNADDKKQTVDQLQRLTSKQADPLLQREALGITLANPAATKDIPSDQLTKLKAVLNGPGDPAKVVQKVYDYMANDYWFRKGAAQTKASAFYQTYLNELNQRLDKSKQIDASLLMNKLNDLDRSGQELIKSRDSHIANSAAFLNKGQIQESHDAHPIAPPQNPADAFKDFNPTQGTDVLGPPTTQMGPPPAQGPMPPAPGLAERAIMGAGNAVSNMADNSAAYFSAPPGGGPPLVARDLLGVGGREDYSPAPTQAQVLANRAAVDARMGKQQVAAIPPANQAEADAIKQTALQMGVTPDQINQADQAFKNGTATPNMIKTHNMILNIVRSKQGQTTNMPPAGAPADAY